MRVTRIPGEGSKPRGSALTMWSSLACHLASVRLAERSQGVADRLPRCGPGTHLVRVLAEISGREVPPLSLMDYDVDPEVEVWVGEPGALHAVDPSRHRSVTCGSTDQQSSRDRMGHLLDRMGTARMRPPW